MILLCGDVMLCDVMLVTCDPFMSEPRAERSASSSMPVTCVRLLRLEMPLAAVALLRVLSSATSVVSRASFLSHQSQSMLIKHSKCESF